MSDAPSDEWRKHLKLCRVCGNPDCAHICKGCRFPTHNLFWGGHDVRGMAPPPNCTPDAEHSGLCRVCEEGVAPHTASVAEIARVRGRLNAAKAGAPAAAAMALPGADKDKAQDQGKAEVPAAAAAAAAVLDLTAVTPKIPPAPPVVVDVTSPMVVVRPVPVAAADAPIAPAMRVSGVTTPPLPSAPAAPANSVAAALSANASAAPASSAAATPSAPATGAMDGKHSAVVPGGLPLGTAYLAAVRSRSYGAELRETLMGEKLTGMTGATADAQFCLFHYRDGDIEWVDRFVRSVHALAAPVRAAVASGVFGMLLVLAPMTPVERMDFCKMYNSTCGTDIAAEPLRLQVKGDLWILMQQLINCGVFDDELPPIAMSPRAFLQETALQAVNVQIPRAPQPHAVGPKPAAAAAAAASAGAPAPALQLPRPAAAAAAAPASSSAALPALSDDSDSMSDSSRAAAPVTIAANGQAKISTDSATGGAASGAAADGGIRSITMAQKVQSDAKEVGPHVPLTDKNDARERHAMLCASTKLDYTAAGRSEMWAVEPFDAVHSGVMRSFWVRAQRFVGDDSRWHFITQGDVVMFRSKHFGKDVLAYIVCVAYKAHKWQICLAVPLDTDRDRYRIEFSGPRTLAQVPTGKVPRISVADAKFYAETVDEQKLQGEADVTAAKAVERGNRKASRKAEAEAKAKHANSKPAGAKRSASDAALSEADAQTDHSSDDSDYSQPSDGDDEPAPAPVSRSKAKPKTAAKPKPTPKGNAKSRAKEEAPPEDSKHKAKRRSVAVAAADPPATPPVAAKKKSVPTSKRQPSPVGAAAAAATPKPKRAAAAAAEVQAGTVVAQQPPGDELKRLIASQAAMELHMQQQLQMNALLTNQLQQAQAQAQYRPRPRPAPRAAAAAGGTGTRAPRAPPRARAWAQPQQPAAAPDPAAPAAASASTAFAPFVDEENNGVQETSSGSAFGALGLGPWMLQTQDTLPMGTGQPQLSYDDFDLDDTAAVDFTSGHGPAPTTATPMGAWPEQQLQQQPMTRGFGRGARGPSAFGQPHGPTPRR